MEIDSDQSSSKRNFGHCIVTWEIKNYGRMLWQKNVEIKTPEFSIKGPNSRYTKWKLTLHTEPNSRSFMEKLGLSVNSKTNRSDSESLSEDFAKADFALKVRDDENSKQKMWNENEGEDHKLPVKNLMLILERTGSEEEQNSVRVDCKVYCIGIDGRKFPVAHQGNCFRQKFRHGFNIGVIYDLEKEFEYNSGVTTILCDMLVQDVSTDITIDDDVNIDLRGLSEDLQWIFDRQKFCDAEIKVGSKRVMVHKALLRSHGNFFENAFKEQDTIELLDINYNEMLKILEYMYSYELKDVIGQPSVSIYDYVIYMNLTELAAHYVPEEQKIITTLDIRKSTFSWIVKDFSSIELISISSPIFCRSIEEAAWQIHLYPNGTDGKSEYIAIAVECIEGNICDDFCIECAVLDENEKLNTWKTLRKSDPNVDSVFQDETFIRRKYILKLQNNDALRIGLKIRMCIDKHHTVVNNACSPVLYSEKESFEQMTKNMLALYQSKEFSDVILKIQNEEIKAHKFILAARSYLFSSMLEETGDNVIVLSNISPETLKVLLDYMYYAVLNVSDVDKIIDVYKAAEEFVIPRLQEKCSRILQDSITTDTVCNVLRLADDYDDQYLKSEALEFIISNEDLFRQHIRDNMKVERNFLYQGNEEIAKDENSSKSSFSVQSNVKTITILKYNEDSIISVDYELASRTLNERDIKTLQNYKGSLDKNLVNLEIENGQLDLKESQRKGEKTFQEFSKIQETASADTKSDEAIKDIQENSQNDKNTIKETASEPQTASKICSITIANDEEKNITVEPFAKTQNEELYRSVEELEAKYFELQGKVSDLNEFNGNKVELNVASSELNGKGLKSGEDNDVLESSKALDEMNGKKIGM